MRSVCLIFQIHLPLLLNRFRFFEIGENHSYIDEASMKSRLGIASKELLLPLNHMLLRQIKSRGGKLRVAFYLSGVTAEQLRIHTPEVYESFRALAVGGYTEFMTGTYSFSLASLFHEEAFRKQVAEHRTAMEEFNGSRSQVFYNTGLIYSDELGKKAAEMELKGCMAEGARPVLGWKSPGNLYANAGNSDFKILFRHPEPGNDLQHCLEDAVQSSEQPSPARFFDRLASSGAGDELVNLIVDLDPLYRKSGNKNGMIGFLDHFLFMASQSPDFRFLTPSEMLESGRTDSPVHAPNPVSRNYDGSHDPEWIRNELQQEALSKLYDLTPLIQPVLPPELKRDWNNLQCAEHFRYMSTENYGSRPSDPENPYNSPFEAFINYMNILNDFKIRMDHYSRM